MYLSEYSEQSIYMRKSKTGKEHEYTRTKTYVNFRCDNCDREFTRARSKISPNRLNNNVFHVCDNCDSKKFAQRKGVEKKQMWNMTASSSQPISKF
jgi:Zn finger protein HypA/HybF involved in hydrogenase expression